MSVIGHNHAKPYMLRTLTRSGGGPSGPQRIASLCACTRRTRFSSSFRPCSALSPARV